MQRLLASVTPILQSNFQRLPYPYKLTFAITYRCNSRCTICNIWKKPHLSEMTFDDIKKIFVANPYFRWVNLTGGEVFLRPDLIDIIKMILDTQKNLYFLNFPTNGIMTKRIVEQVQQILLLGPPHFIVSISLDGPEQLHDKLRGIKENWKHAVKTYQELKKLRSSHFDTYFGMTLSHYNSEFIEQTYKDLKQVVPNLKRSDIHFNIAHYSSHYYGNTKQDGHVETKTIEYLDAYNKKKGIGVTKISWIEYLYQRHIKKYLMTKKTPVPCLALSSSVFLNPYGTIYPCSMWNMPLANIKDINYNLRAIWNTKKAKKIHNLITHKKCPNCWTPCEAYQSILGNLFSPTVWKK